MTSLSRSTTHNGAKRNRATYYKRALMVLGISLIVLSVSLFTAPRTSVSQLPTHTTRPKAERTSPIQYPGSFSAVKPFPPPNHQTNTKETNYNTTLQAEASGSMSAMAFECVVVGYKDWADRGYGSLFLRIWITTGPLKLYKYGCPKIDSITLDIAKTVNSGYEDIELRTLNTSGYQVRPITDAEYESGKSWGDEAVSTAIGLLMDAGAILFVCFTGGTAAGILAGSYILDAEQAGFSDWFGACVDGISNVISDGISHYSDIQWYGSNQRLHWGMGNNNSAVAYTDIELRLYDNAPSVVTPDLSVVLHQLQLTATVSYSFTAPYYAPLTATIPLTFTQDLYATAVQLVNPTEAQTYSTRTDAADVTVKVGPYDPPGFHSPDPSDTLYQINCVAVYCDGQTYALSPASYNYATSTYDVKLHLAAGDSINPVRGHYVQASVINGYARNSCTTVTHFYVRHIQTVFTSIITPKDGDAYYVGSSQTYVIVQVNATDTLTQISRVQISLGGTWYDAKFFSGSSSKGVWYYEFLLNSGSPSKQYRFQAKATDIQGYYSTSSNITVYICYRTTKGPTPN